MRVSKIAALLITAMMIPAISGCTTQGSPAPDAVHQIEDDGPENRCVGGAVGNVCGDQSGRHRQRYFRLPAVNFFEMSERCNILHLFSMKFFGCCNISRTFGFYNTLINRQEALKGVLNMSVLQTIDLKKYYGTKPNITRALITKPAIVLADEPTGNLDSKTSAEVLGLIKHTSAEFRQTVVMITHNNDIARLADRIVRIEDGKIVE